MDSETLEQEVQRAEAAILHTRDAAVSRPRNLATFLAGDNHLGGPMPGVLDALAEGLLREAGLGGRANAIRRKLIHDIITQGLLDLEKLLNDRLGREGLQPASCAEVSAELSGVLQESLRAFIEDFYGPEYELAAQAARALVEGELNVQPEADPAFA